MTLQTVKGSYQHPSESYCPGSYAVALWEVEGYTRKPESMICQQCGRLVKLYPPTIEENRVFRLSAHRPLHAEYSGDLGAPKRHRGAKP
jgi:hypothetical protein